MTADAFLAVVPAQMMYSGGRDDVECECTVGGVWRQHCDGERVGRRRGTLCLKRGPVLPPLMHLLAVAVASVPALMMEC